MTLKGFMESETGPQTYPEAFWHILQNDCASSVSYGTGTHKGPEAIINASQQLESWDSQLVIDPSKLGIFTHQPIKSRDGDWFKRQHNDVSRILHDNKFPIIIGGEHSVTLATIQAIVESDIPVGVVQIDAHCDLRDSYDGTQYSHACTLRRIHELLPDKVHIHQIGTRALCEEEYHYRHLHNKTISSQNQNDHLSLPMNFPDKVFLTIDTDGFDPSVFPSTGTPVQGGLFWNQALQIITDLAEQRQIIGFDLVEFAPIPNFHCYDFAAAQLIYKVMSIIQRAENL